MSSHLIVLGAGVIGLSTALECARRGMRVTVIEKKPAQRDGCSFGNAGMIVPSHFIPLAAPGVVWQGLRWMWNPESPFYIHPRLDSDLLAWGWRFWRAANRAHVAAAAPVLRDFGLLSRACFDELGLEMGLVKKGLLMLCQKAQTLDEEAPMAEQARQLGLPAEVLDARATAALDPGITMAVAGSIYFPKDAHLSPGQLVAALEAELHQRGATFLWETEVTGFDREGQVLRAVQTSRGLVVGDEFVLCSGVWSSAMARSLNLKLPMQAGKGYSLTLPHPRQLPELCSLCTEARLAVTPMGTALRFGGTMEMAGLDESISQRRVQGIIRAVSAYFPAFEPADFANIEPWSGLRPVSPDGLPYLGRSAGWQNLTIATGHAMMGLSLAAATARLVGEILFGEKPSIPLRLFSPDRYA